MRRRERGPFGGRAPTPEQATAEGRAELLQRVLSETSTENPKKTKPEKPVTYTVGEETELQLSREQLLYSIALAKDMEREARTPLELRIARMRLAAAEADFVQSYTPPVPEVPPGQNDPRPEAVSTV